jgi:hypothetical protein
MENSVAADELTILMKFESQKNTESSHSEQVIWKGSSLKFKLCLCCVKGVAALRHRMLRQKKTNHRAQKPEEHTPQYPPPYSLHFRCSSCRPLLALDTTRITEGIPLGTTRARKRFRDYRGASPPARIAPCCPPSHRLLPTSPALIALLPPTRL